jgi:hypothetical protein
VVAPRGDRQRAAGDDLQADRSREDPRDGGQVGPGAVLTVRAGDGRRERALAAHLGARHSESELAVAHDDREAVVVDDVGRVGESSQRRGVGLDARRRGVAAGGELPAGKRGGATRVQVRVDGVAGEGIDLDAVVAVVEFGGGRDAGPGVAAEGDSQFAVAEPVESLERRPRPESDQDRLPGVERREETGTVLGGERRAVAAGGRRRFDAGRSDREPSDPVDRCRGVDGERRLADESPEPLDRPRERREFALPPCLWRQTYNYQWPPPPMTSVRKRTNRPTRK